MTDKNIYRCIVRYVDPKYSRSISNLFFRQSTAEAAIQATKLVMADEFRKNGIKPIEFVIEVVRSSMEEAKLYREKISTNGTLDRMVN